MSPRLSAAIFSLVAAVVASVVYLFPLGDENDISESLRALTFRGSVAVVGNSVIDHTSKCDPDSRSIAGLVAADMNAPVLDLSASGQLLDESLAFAGIAARNKHISTIVLALSYSSFTDDWHPSFQRAWYFDIVSLNPTHFNAFRNLLEKFSVVQTDVPAHKAFSYGGKDYPDYDGVKARYFQPEKDAMPCPENDGKNATFINAYYNRIYTGSPIRRENIDAVAQFIRFGRQRGVTVKAVLMPIDYDLISSRSPADADRIRKGVAEVLAGLHQRDVAVLDLTGSIPNPYFADRWCACGHLQYPGRDAVARAVVESLRDTKG